MPGSVLYEAIARRAGREGHALAILAPGRPPLTYGGLALQIQRTAARLSDLGLGAGDRVACALPGGPELAVAVLAMGSAAACAPLNPALRRPEYDLFSGTRVRPGCGPRSSSHRYEHHVAPAGRPRSACIHA